MSPAVGRMMNGSQSTTAALNNRNRSPPGTARDSFLNYFFSKDSNNAYANPQQAAQAALDNRPGSRHVSQNNEPSFAQSIRRGDDEQPAHVLAMMPPDADDYDARPSNPEQAPALTEREALETELIRRLISSYFNIVRETVTDQVPKAIMHLLVNHSKDVVQNRLVSTLYKENLFQELLNEDDTVKAEREKCEKLLKTYKEAFQDYQRGFVRDRCLDNETNHHGFLVGFENVRLSSLCPASD
ncbi:unnamed protein product [Alternaria alternata]